MIQRNAKRNKYNNKNQKIFQCKPDGCETYFTYNDFGKIMKWVNSKNEYATWDYSEDGTLRKFRLSTGDEVESKYFEDEPDKKCWSKYTRFNSERKYNKNGDVIEEKTKNYFIKYHYIHRNSYWKNGNIKKKTIYSWNIKYKRWNNQF